MQEKRKFSHRSHIDHCRKLYEKCEIILWFLRILGQKFFSAPNIRAKAFFTIENVIIENLSDIFKLFSSA